MKIRKLHIKNYKIFNDIELDFTDANGQTLDKVVLAGVNGCGKTTVLEIIMQFFNGNFLNIFHNTSVEFEVEMTFEEQKEVLKNLAEYIDINDRELKNEYLSNFYNQLKSNKKYSSLLFNDDNSFALRLILDAIFLKPKSIPLIYLPVNDNVKSSKIFLKILHISSDKSKMKELALKDIRNEIFKNEDIAPRKSKEKAIKRITKALNGLVLTTKLVDLDSEELIFESVNGKRIKFEELSNGEQTLYFRAIYLSTLNPQNSIIMVDEPEESLHPTWQQKVLKLYQNIGENNQVIVATHSPHIIGSSNAEEVFLLEIDEQGIEAAHPKYTKGHSIDYILEVMGANPRDTSVINTVDDYLALVRKGMHETEMGLTLKANIDALNLDPNSAEMRRIDLSLKRFNAVGV